MPRRADRRPECGRTPPAARTSKLDVQRSTFDVQAQRLTTLLLLPLLASTLATLPARAQQDRTAICAELLGGSTAVVRGTITDCTHLKDSGHTARLTISVTEVLKGPPLTTLTAVTRAPRSDLESRYGPATPLLIALEPFPGDRYLKQFGLSDLRWSATWIATLDGREERFTTFSLQPRPSPEQLIAAVRAGVAAGIDVSPSLELDLIDRGDPHVPQKVLVPVHPGTEPAILRWSDERRLSDVSVINYFRLLPGPRHEQRVRAMLASDEASLREFWAKRDAYRWQWLYYPVRFHARDLLKSWGLPVPRIETSARALKHDPISTATRVAFVAAILIVLTLSILAPRFTPRIWAIGPTTLIALLLLTTLILLHWRSHHRVYELVQSNGARRYEAWAFKGSINSLRVVAHAPNPDLPGTVMEAEPLAAGAFPIDWSYPFCGHRSLTPIQLTELHHDFWQPETWPAFTTTGAPPPTYERAGLRLARGSITPFNNPTLDFVHVRLPLWPFTALCSLPVLAWSWRLVRGVVRHLRGRCRVCGYDLRATPQRCPECGLESKPIAPSQEPSSVGIDSPPVNVPP